MANINIKSLTFAYEGTYENIFYNVDLNLDTNWKLALIGRNGRGKTTFLKLLCGQYAYKGTISANINFTYFPFDIPDENMSAETLAGDICSEAELWQLERELNLLDVKEEILYQPFYSLSGGEKTKVMLALMFLKENTFFLIDEPTNHLDMAGRNVLGNYLKRKKGFILVSHDRALIDGCADHILSINKTDIELLQGNFSVWQQNSEYRENFERKQNERLKTEITKLSEAAARASGWSDTLEATKYDTKNSGLRPDRGYIGAKSAKLMQQKKNAENRIARDIEQKKSLLNNLERNDALKIVTEETRRKKLVEFSHVNIYYGGVCAASDINFTLYAGERLAVEGKNGSGKTSILKIIMGENINYTGSVYVAPSLNISYVSQDSSFLKGRVCDLAESMRLDKPVFMAMLTKLGLSSDSLTQNAENMSLGQKKKVLLAASISSRAHLYIWDEPLNYIDIISRIQIEEVIVRDRPTMIFTEHDRAFCEAVADKTVEV